VQIEGGTSPAPSPSVPRHGTQLLKRTAVVIVVALLTLLAVRA
jgi:hypothetical protein